MTTEIIFEIFLELPYWINLRKGNYRFPHESILESLLNDNEIETGTISGSENYTLHVDNFVWKIGFDHLKEYPDTNLHHIYISEDLENYIIISDEELEQFFGYLSESVFFQKLKTYLRKRYRFEIEFKNKEKSSREIIAKFAEAIKQDFLKALNEFIEIYIGYFSSRTFCNEAYLLGPSVFTSDKVQVKIIFNGEDITRSIGFPIGFYSHPYYPSVFPKVEKEREFFQLLGDGRKPSFTKVLKGISNYFFLHGDKRIGILYLDMALESCINDFIKFYNNNNPNYRLRRIRRNRTIRDFLVEDLPSIISQIFPNSNQQLIANVVQFHNERNLIVHRKKRRINERRVNDLRESVVSLINGFERFMRLPVIINDQNVDFNKNPIGISLDYIEGGSWGRIELFKSFTDMVNRMNQNRDQTE